MRSKSACRDSFLRIESCFCLRSGRLLGKKNGIPLYPNLVNLKSNTMKNTLQRYDGCFLYASDLQEKISECYEFNLNYNFVKVLSCKNGFLLIGSVGRGDDGALLRRPQKPMAKNRARSLEPMCGKRAANQTAPRIWCSKFREFLHDFLPNNMAVAAQLPLKGRVFKIQKNLCMIFDQIAWRLRRSCP